LRAYLQAFPEGTFEETDLRLMLRRACLRISVTRLYDQLHPRVDGLVTPKNPLDFLNHLQEHRAGAVSLYEGVL
jgi:hypothetical protein